MLEETVSKLKVMLRGKNSLNDVIPNTTYQCIHIYYTIRYACSYCRYCRYVHVLNYIYTYILSKIGREASPDDP